MRAAIPAVDAAVVVCEADERKLPQLQIILRELEDLGIPRFLFLNKIDRANKRIRETLATLQPASRIPLVLRQIPIWNGDLIAGFVDRRWNAPLSTANTRLPKSWHSKAATSTARRKPASRCWKSSPITTMR